jgi:hypothetical protein
MSQGPAPDRIARELRYLKLYALCSSAALIALCFSAFAPAAQRFQVIDAERINIRNADGKLALAIAGKGLLPGPTSEGKEYPQRYSGGRTTASGMIFFNERGDEVGGLTYHGDLTENGYSSGGGITFDQFRQDQVVSLSYSDNGRRRSAGMTVWDRSTQITLDSILKLVDRRENAQGAERDSLQAFFQQLGRQGLAATRAFLGSENRTASLRLLDTRGRTRIRMYVDSLDVARLEFVDSAGTVLSRFPQ